jgi:ceramide glucosyltransferase
MHIAYALGQGFVVGKAMCFRRSTLDRFGGMRRLARYIAEDYMAGQAVRRLGLRVVMLPEPIRQHIGGYSFEAFWSRHLRWGRIRRAQAPLAFAIEPLQFPLISGLLGAWGASETCGVPFAAFLVGHLAVWLALDLLLMVRMEAKLNGNTVAGWIVRECLAFPLWCHMASGSSIHWRGTELRILPGGLVERVADGATDLVAAF